MVPSSALNAAALTAASQWVVFACGDHLFGLPLDRTREILPPRPVTRLPGCGPEVAGLAGIRGRVVTVFDFGVLLVGKPSAQHAEHRMLVVVVAGKRLAVLVDEIDQYLRTTAKHVWGVGDVTGAPRFTHVADYQARLVLRNALFPGRSAADYTIIPWAVYTIPEVAHIGMTEEQAREQHGGGVQVWRRHFGELDRAVADAHTEGLVKVIADRRGKILGAHVIGHQASTMLGELTLAIKTNTSLSAIASTMHAYPTYPEAIKQTGDAFTRTRLTGLTKRIAGWLVRH